MLNVDARILKEWVYVTSYIHSFIWNISASGCFAVYDGNHSAPRVHLPGHAVLFLMQEWAWNAGAMEMRTSLVLTMRRGHNLEVAGLCWDNKECGRLRKMGKSRASQEVSASTWWHWFRGLWGLRGPEDAGRMKKRFKCLKSEGYASYQHRHKEALRHPWYLRTSGKEEVWMTEEV